jgi:tetratricopeptide (TPR) repeat protein
MRAKVLREPRSAEAWGLFGKVLFAHGYVDEALVCFAQAERLDAANPRWPYYQAMIFMLRDPAIGLRHLRRAVDACDGVEPANTAPWLLLADALAGQGRHEDAATEFGRVLEQEPDNPRAHYGLGLIAFARQDWQTSRTHWQRCLGSPMARRKACLRLAAVCQRLGDSKGADEFSAKAKRLPKDADWIDPFATEYLHLAVGKQGRFKEVERLESERQLGQAVDLLRKMADDYPDEYRVYNQLGRDLGQLKKYSESEQALRTAIRLAPDKVPAYYYLSVTLYSQAEIIWRASGDREAALALFRESADCARQALKGKPDHGYAHLFLGLSLKYLDRRPEALASLRDAVRCCPDLPEMHLSLGEMLAEDGRTDEARAHLQQVVERTEANDPRRLAALERLKTMNNEGRESK